MAQSLASSCGYRRMVSEGTTGPIAYACARTRVTWCKDGLPNRTGWLVLQRTLGSSPTYASSISNAPESTPLRLCVWFSGIRWAMEQCCEDTKPELGMAHYAGRKSPGWHHHLLTCMVAHCFLWRLKIRLGKKSPSADGVATAHLVSGDPPLTHLHGARGPRAGGVGPAVQSPGLSVAQKAS